MAAPTGGGFGYTLMHAAQTWRTGATTVLAPFELTVPQFLVVVTLFRQARHDWAPLSQSQVGERLGMDANTTSQIVRGLERRGVLTRRAHPHDARARALTLTVNGLERATAAATAARAFNDVYFGKIPVDQLEALGTTLEKLSAQSEGRS